MTLDAKIHDAIRITSNALSQSKNPVVAFSSGKDSTVMLHIQKFKLGLDLPVLFHREPFMHGKYLFGLSLLHQWRCTAYDYPPIAVSMWEGNGYSAFTNEYQIGLSGNSPVVMLLPKNILEPEPGKPYLCGKLDIMKRPLGSFAYPWDMVFLGHKDTDEDQIAGKVPLHCEIKTNEHGPSAAFPLKNWTDKDVWDYLDRNKIPVQADRYDRISRTERKDKTNNGDYFHVCIRCIDRRLKGKVMCPMLNEEIDNISEQVPYREIAMDYFG